MMMSIDMADRAVEADLTLASMSFGNTLAIIVVIAVVYWMVKPNDKRDAATRGFMVIAAILAAAILIAIFHR